MQGRGAGRSRMRLENAPKVSQKNRYTPLSFSVMAWVDHERRIVPFAASLLAMVLSCAR